MRNLDLEIPLGKLTVVTGPSGSGKSSLAFHTLYAEGQRRYVETFSPYVRQFFDRMDKPDVDAIEGIPPAIAIEQKNHTRSTRSTVGTLTEINDYLKLLFTRAATAHDPQTGEVIAPDTAASATAWAMQNLADKTILITFPVPAPVGAKPAEFFAFLNQQGYLRVLLDDTILRTDEPPKQSRLPAVVEVLQDRIKLTRATRSRLLEAMEAAFTLGKGKASLSAIDDGGKTILAHSFSADWTNPTTGFTLRPPTPSLFSFNNPVGACPTCRGFGRVIGIDPQKSVPDPSLSIRKGAIKPFQGERGGECQRDLLRCCKENGIDVNTPWEDLSEDEQEWIYYGDRRKADLTPEELEELWSSGSWYGVKGFFDWLETKAYKMHVRVFLSRYRSYTSCHTCRGKRLQPESLCFKIDGKSLPELWAMPVDELLTFLKRLQSSERIKHSADSTLTVVLTEIASRLGYLVEVGLGYLTLDRQTRTLSGGEVERVNLTTCLGASLTGTLFVLDEPTVGLHTRDIDRLVGIMHSLRDKGNTLVVVEHENTVMRAADHLVDLGPGAGQHGGKIIYQGPPDSDDAKNKKSMAPNETRRWLRGEKFILVPAKRRPRNKTKLSVRGATRHNLKKLDADLPLGLFVCLTGVSGSGKSTLAHDVIHANVARRLGIEDTSLDPAPIKDLLGTQYLSGVALVDQSPLARTPRSTPALLLGAFEPIRQLFTMTDEARARGLQGGFFSFNSGDGRCDRCSGSGCEQVEMQFLADIQVTCPACNGRRYKSSTLEFTYRGRSIADVLELSASEVAEAFALTPETPAAEARLIKKIHAALAPLVEVGLGYLKLGQALNTLSGGESQRLKLCQLLSEATSTQQGTKLLILDEPTTGLHFSDIERLLGVFQKLVDAG
ncbi:MAG: excinuclease ABC subunit UvrA, partial [Luteolibacter sp.]